MKHVLGGAAMRQALDSGCTFAHTVLLLYGWLRGCSGPIGAVLRRDHLTLQQRVPGVAVCEVFPLPLWGRDRARRRHTQVGGCGAASGPLHALMNLWLAVLNVSYEDDHFCGYEPSAAQRRVRAS